MTCSNNVELYAAIWEMIVKISPIVLSVLGFAFSIYIGVIHPRKKKCEANLVWDEIVCCFYIIIKNTGEAPLVIDSVELFYYNNRFCEESLGIRKNIWSLKYVPTAIEKGKAIYYKPLLGSIYDVFAYKGHNDIELTNKIYNAKVFIRIQELQGKKFKIRSKYCLGQIVDKI